MRQTGVFMLALLAELLPGSLTSTRECARPVSRNVSMLFRHCSCQLLDHHGSTAALDCRRATWPAIPSNMSVLLFGEMDHNTTTTATYHHHFTRPASLSRLRVADGVLTQLAQDTFKGEFIEELDLGGNCIDSVNVNAFRGLETKLQQVSLRANCLSAIPSPSLIYLSRLQHLHLEDNHIDRIPAEAFTQNQLLQLKFLYLDGNRLAELPSGALKPLSAVQVLTLAGNRIRQLDEGSLPPALWFLDLKGNRLPEIPYAALRGLGGSLNTLDLESNSIEALAPGAGVMEPPNKEHGGGEINLLLASNLLPELQAGSFAAFPRMNRLDLRYNRIASVHERSFQGASSLRDLDLGHNRLVHLPHNSLAPFANSLRRLSLESNGFARVPTAIKHLRVLESLDLSNNRLRALDRDDEVLAKLRSANITTLRLAGNQLSRIPASALEGMHQLAELDLSANRIDRIEKMAFGAFNDGPLGGSRSLVRLNLAGNLIGEVTDSGAFLYASELAQLDLSFNRIRRLTRVAFERLEALESLHLQNNAILEFPRNALSSLTRLKYLLVDNNHLLNLPNYAFQWLVHLEHLSLSHNRIHTLNAKTFHSTSAIQLKSLNLAHNRIATMHTAAFEDLPNLEHLYLNDNQLVQLQTQIISSLRSLKTLTLAHNQINETQESAFTNLPHLHRLSLAHNRLRTMKEGIVRRVPQLAHLDLSHNRIEAFDLDFLEEDSVHQLRYLDLSHNVIRKLELSPAKRSLLRLEAQHNQLEFVDNPMLQGFEQLESLDLSHNDLIEVGHEALWKSHQLRRVILSDNNLRTLGRETFSEQRMIHRLDLGNNMLSALAEGTFGRNNLFELCLSRNNFTSVPIAALKSVARSLSTLDLSYNALHSLSRRDFQGLHNVSSLSLAHNRIESIGDEAFGELVNLRTLDLSGNPVSAWSPNAFVGVGRLLGILNLASLGLFSMPRLVAPQLKSLCLSHNKIYELHAEDFESIGAPLESLDLAGNNLVDVKVAVLQALPNLRHLNLSENSLHHLQTEHFKALSQLESLHLANMSALLRLPDPSAFAHLTALKRLDLKGLPRQTTNSNISAILFHTPPLRALEIELWQEELGPEVLAGADLRLLRQLTIHGKTLKSVHARAFEGHLFGYRVELALEHTSIRVIPAQLLSHMPGVRNVRLSLRHNLIETIDLFAPGSDDKGEDPDHLYSLQDRLNWQRTRLERMDLAGNPLVCDCRMSWLTVWLGHLASSVDPYGPVWAEAKRALLEAKCSNRLPSKHHRQKHPHPPHFRQFYHQKEEARGRLSLWDVYQPGGISSTGELLCDEKGRLISSGAAVSVMILPKWTVGASIVLFSLAGTRWM